MGFALGYKSRSFCCLAMFLTAIGFTFVSTATGGINCKEMANSLVTVVGLDSQGRPAYEGIGVVAGRNGQVLTSARLFSQSRTGVVKTATGNLLLIQDLIFFDPLQDLALVRIEAADLRAVPLAVPGRLRLKDKLWMAVKEKNSFGFQEVQLTGIHPLSPRLTLLKLQPPDPQRPPGTAVFNGQGELVGMLHSFSPESKAGLHFFLSRDCTQVNLKEAGKFDNGLERGSSENRSGEGRLAFWEGVAAANRQSWPEARDKFNQALAFSGNLPEAYYGRGVARYHRRDYSGAIKDLEEAARGLPGYALAFLWLGKAWERQGNQEQAQASYEKATSLSPDLSEAWFLLGQLAYQEGRLTKARECLERANDDPPHGARRRWYLGNIARRQHRPQEALEAYELAIKLSPGFSPAYLEGGKLLLELGRPEEAAHLLSQIVGREPGDPLARYYLASAYLLSWNPAGAWEQYFILREMQPDLAARLAIGLEVSAK